MRINFYINNRIFKISFLIIFYNEIKQIFTYSHIAIVVTSDQNLIFEKKSKYV